ncbi:hypothetical protein FOA52_003505 [Chlamydomonas sp. UWO 241]|nr:hypothetical protein FOA52_003505 [Chlamydomonas sp. UWO 241]
MTKDTSAQTHHDVAVKIHSNQHKKVEDAKDVNERKERHSGTGHTIKEGPKKAGAGGKGVWGTVNDDIQDAVAARATK